MYGTWPKDLLVFHLELVHKFLEQVRSQKGVRPGAGKERVDMVDWTWSQACLSREELPCARFGKDCANSGCCTCTVWHVQNYWLSFHTYQYNYI